MLSKESGHAAALTQGTRINNVFLSIVPSRERCQRSGKRPFIERSVDNAFHLEEASFKYPPTLCMFDASVFRGAWIPSVHLRVFFEQKLTNDAFYSYYFFSWSHMLSILSWNTLPGTWNSLKTFIIFYLIYKYIFMRSRYLSVSLNNKMVHRVLNFTPSFL